MVADAIQAMTGTDIAAPLRGYSSRAEAIQAIATHTGACGSMDAPTARQSLAVAPTVEAAAETLAQANAMIEIPVTHAKRGDMALIPRARDFSMGIVNLNGSRLTIAMRRGTAEVPLDRACRAWRV